MAILNTGINGIRDIVASGVTVGDWGTGTAFVLASDTDLQTPISSVDQPVVATVSDKTISLNTSIPSTAGNGSTITEHVKRLNTGDAILRATFTGISKDNTKSIHNIDTIVFVPIQ